MLKLTFTLFLYPFTIVQKSRKIRNLWQIRWKNYLIHILCSSKQRIHNQWEKFVYLCWSEYCENDNRYEWVPYIKELFVLMLLVPEETIVILYNHYRLHKLQDGFSHITFLFQQKFWTLLIFFLTISFSEADFSNRNWK